ncbi:uncharacterized protein BDV17DRAFT_287442 [Aspergillus undulatus]|uniref:uncharacterized protein n=1 Tax=Aspergillus undulatus TaxID=1810928 RepID=UPI003CCD4D99
MAYQLSISLAGPGITENAHWGFTIHTPGKDFGDLLHVRLITSTHFQFENRTGHGLAEQDAWGLAPITLLDDVQRAAVVSILEKERPPTNGRDCQSWVVDGLVALEVEELVPPGTAEVWSARLGKETALVREEAGGVWVALNGR